MTFPNGKSCSFVPVSPLITALSFSVVGWINSLRVLGDTFKIEGFYTVHLIMTILICIAWLVLITLTLMAFWKGLIFRSKEEDVIKDSVPIKELADEDVDIEKGQSYLHT